MNKIQTSIYFKVFESDLINYKLETNSNFNAEF